MARVVGVNIPDEKSILIGLTYIYGIGLSLSKKILEQAKIDKKKKAKELTPDDLNVLKQIIEKNYRVEGELKRDIMTNIKRLKDIRAYRGIRHKLGLPEIGRAHV